jgi:hypothetical protein
VSRDPYKVSVTDKVYISGLTPLYLQVSILVELSALTTLSYLVYPVLMPVRITVKSEVE